MFNKERERERDFNETNIFVFLSIHRKAELHFLKFTKILHRMRMLGRTENVCTGRRIMNKGIKGIKTKIFLQ